MALCRWVYVRAKLNVSSCLIFNKAHIELMTNVSLLQEAFSSKRLSGSFEYCPSIFALSGFFFPLKLICYCCDHVWQVVGKSKGRLWGSVSMALFYWLDLFSWASHLHGPLFRDLKASLDHRASSPGNYLHQRQRTWGEVIEKWAKLMDPEEVTRAARRDLLCFHRQRSRLRNYC